MAAALNDSVTANGGVAGKVSSIPLELCDTSPDLKRRFDYYDDIDALAESIHANGQIHPGVVFKKPDGRYEVVVGFRRLFACRKSLELNGAPAGFLAIVLDEVPSEKERHILALAENEGEKGQRRDLTVEELVAYFGSMAKKFSEEEVLEIGTRAGKSPETVRRLMKLSGAMGEEKVHDAYRIEKAAGFRFGLDHLEELSKIPDLRAFAEAAATTAVIKAGPDEIEKDVLPVAKEVCKGIPWLAEKFPEFGTIEKEEEKGEKEVEDEEEDIGGASSVIPTCYFVICPHKKCGAGSLVEFKAKGEITDDYLWSEKGLEKTTTSANVELSGWRTCRWCGDEFFVSISREDEDRAVHIRASVTKTTERVRTTKATIAEPCTVKRGSGEDWVLVMGGKKYLYGRDGKLREVQKRAEPKRGEEGKENDGRQRRG